MYRETIYKATKETHKLETLLIDQLRKLPANKRSQTVTKDQFDVFLKNIPEFAQENYKMRGIPLGIEKEFTIRCAYYERQFKTSV